MLDRDKILCIDLKNKRMNKKKTVLKKRLNRIRQKVHEVAWKKN